MTLALAVVGVAAIAVYYARRDTRSTCQRIAGTPQEIETATGQSLVVGYHYDGKYACTQELEDAYDHRVIAVEVEDRGYTTPPDDSRFARVEPFGTGKLYVAGDAKAPSPDELMAEAQKQVAAGSHDGIGAALAASPETRHVVIVPFGARDLRISFDRVVPLDRAKAYAAIVEGRLRKHD